MQDSSRFSLGNFQLPQSHFTTFGAGFGGNTAYPSLPSIPPSLTWDRTTAPVSLLTHSYQPASFGHTQAALHFDQSLKSAAEVAPSVALDLATHLSPSLKGPAIVIDAAQTARELVHRIDKELDKGTEPKEAVLCQSLKTLTESAVTGAGVTALTTGLPVYLTTAAASLAAGNPLPAMALPGVGGLFPTACAGAAATGQRG